MDTVTKLAGECDRTADTTHVFVTNDAWGHCSAEMRQDALLVDGWSKEVSLDEGATQIRPVAIDSGAIVQRLTERVAGLAGHISERTDAIPAPSTVEAATPAAQQLGAEASEA